MSVWLMTFLLGCLISGGLIAVTLYFAHKE